MSATKVSNGIRMGRELARGFGKCHGCQAGELDPNGSGEPLKVLSLAVLLKVCFSQIPVAAFGKSPAGSEKTSGLSQGPGEWSESFS